MVAEPLLTSGARRVLQAQAEVEALVREQRRAVERVRRLQVGERGERQALATLDGLAALGWHILADRQWPGTRANVDALVVGLGGLLVVDVKTWAEPRIEDGMLWRGDADASDDLDKLLAVTTLVEQATSDLGDEQALVPREVVPLVVLAGRAQGVHRLGRVIVLGEADALGWANRRGNRLGDDQVRTLVATLEEAFPPHVAPARAAAPLVRTPVLPVKAEQPALLDLEDLHASLLEKALSEPLEQWMTFLHPDQAKLVRRSFNGPARIRGAAGTGKTVVALHRAAYLAETRPGRVLVTTFVRTLPDVLRTLYARLAPDTADRVEFVGVHAWAGRLLRERGHVARCDVRRAQTLFNRAWIATGARSPLAALDVPPSYWRDEVCVVIKGRGLVSFEQYAGLNRVGRKLRLTEDQRAAVWNVYAAYEEMLRGAEILDAYDLLTVALESVRRDPLDPEFAAVIVDEVQDLTCSGIRLLHALVGDKRDGLLLLGDGQQAIYPGGFTLAEAGIGPLGGRGTVLRVNYRNTAEVLRAAVEVVAGDEYDDIDGSAVAASAETAALRHGGFAMRADARDEPSLEAALLGALGRTVESGVPLDECAVLALTKAQAHRWCRVIKHGGYAVRPLEDYDGTPGGGVKVGTVKRAKGLEFRVVFVPGLRNAPEAARTGESEATRLERVALQRRELYVAMTRARDGLWVGFLDA